MKARTIRRHASISVIDYRCSPAPVDAPFVELHRSFSVSYVRKGSFGYRSRGQSPTATNVSPFISRPRSSNRSAAGPRSGGRAACLHCPS